ncbi:hypothetical protein B0H19DRAFT_1262606 [Mycena capillaripes]|nr:hypothetical protein B0H19DRAFT_1262606 [Mycena capillaripes]
MCGQSSPPKNAKSTVQCPKAEDVTVWLRWVVSPVSAARVLVEDRSRSIVLPGSDLLVLPLFTPILGQVAAGASIPRLSHTMHIAPALRPFCPAKTAAHRASHVAHRTSHARSWPLLAVEACDNVPVEEERPREMDIALAHRSSSSGEDEVFSSCLSRGVSAGLCAASSSSLLLFVPTQRARGAAMLKTLLLPPHPCIASCGSCGCISFFASGSSPPSPWTGQRASHVARHHCHPPMAALVLFLGSCSWSPMLGRMDYRVRVPV